MKYLLIFLIPILLLSCQETKKKADSGDLPFFHFDQIEHYHTSITDADFQAIQMKQDKTQKEQALLQIVAGNIPVSIKDTLFIKNMEILEFEKDTIDSSLNSKIAHLFSFREISQPISATCNSEYRDVLIFRKKGIIIGMAKVSFDCARHQMIGERYNDSKFGQSGEYKELRKFLNK